jgi:soluble lytic murein transglycosylase-like protein
MKKIPDNMIIVNMMLIHMILFSVVFCGVSHASEDPWSNLRKQYEKTKIKKVIEKEQQDPWKLLRAVYLPFSMSEEKRAVADPEMAKSFTRKFNTRLLQYNTIIKRAANRFNIPQEIIKAVIMAESGGDNYAKAKTTSAKGLMQTIDSTFLMARKGLENEGIYISDDPFEPESSIMAGTWYLNRMYEKSIRDGKIISGNRKAISTWRYSLEYYYAGPVHGAKDKNKIYVFSNGKRRIIDKRAYSKKIQKWAQILAV